MASPKQPTRAVTVRQATLSDLTFVRSSFEAYQRTIAGFLESIDPEMAFEEIWLTDSERLHAFVIEADGAPAGIAFIMGPEYAAAAGKHTDYYWDVLHVDGPYRGTGVTEAAVRAILARLVGTFFMTVLPRNARAVGFWTRCLSHLPGGCVRTTNDEGLIELQFSTATASN